MIDNLFHPTRSDQPQSSTAFDWLFALLALWMISGLYLDGWAHTHGRVDNSFFTPWHAFMYNGALLFLGLLAFHQLRNMRRGYPWRSALPVGYSLSLLGAFTFFAGGGFDLVWHSVFGFEVNLEALLSPSHLILATSGVLMISGPVRSAWTRLQANQRHGWGSLGPAILAVTTLVSILTFFTEFAHPINHLDAAKPDTIDQAHYPAIFRVQADGTAITQLTNAADLFAWSSAWSPDGSQIVYTAGVADGDENDLYIMNTDGSLVRQLTNQPGQEYLPSWSPDGQRIVFVAYSNDLGVIQSINADGSDQRQLTSSASYGPAWSPDGNQIVFTSNDSGTDQLYVIDADGQNRRQLTSQGLYNWGAAWSPDGKQIAYNSNRGEENAQIYLINADGSGEVQLTQGDGENLMPAWSPDGAKIAFVKADQGLYVVSRDGSDLHYLASSHALAGYFNPRWSPDGNQIMFTAFGYSSLPQPYDSQRVAIASILLQTAFLMGCMLLLVRQWGLPFGALTVLVALNSLGMTVFHEHYALAIPAFLAGLAADLLLVWLKPGLQRPRQFYLFSGLVPVIYNSGYFLTLKLTAGMDWIIHLWLGAILLAGVVGLFVGFVYLLPLGISSPPPGRAASAGGEG